MIKKLFIISFLFISLNFLFSQDNSILKVNKFVLENGLTVYLNEDHTVSKVFGVVVVKAGYMNDPKEATGIAHYLEHMLFKGTDELGTIDYDKEKPLLDEINKLYDKLNQTKDKSKKEEIQKEINKISLEASKYAVPNEFSRLIYSIGGEELNAVTYEDKTIYHNYFSPIEIEKWLDIYSQRFINPVFRLFQPELDVVYQEKIQKLNNENAMAWESYFSNFLKNHPHAQGSSLGSIDHIIYPSLSKMKEFYDTYYVANNMALILSGDFNSEMVIKLINNKFNKIKSGKPVIREDIKEEDFKGRVFKTKSVTSSTYGINGFRIVPRNNPDTYGLYLISTILKNDKKSGLIDKIINDNKITNAYINMSQSYDYGMLSITYYPKETGQNLANAEDIVMKEIEKLRKGDFSDELFTLAKNNEIIDYKESMESIRSRSMLIIDSFINNFSLDDMLNYSDKIKAITKDDVIKLADKYLNNNYLAFHISRGAPEKRDVYPTRDIKPVLSNANSESNYSKKFRSIPSSNIKENFVNFNNDVKLLKLKDKVNLYYSNNPINNIFSFTAKYGIGYYKNPLLEYSVKYTKKTASSQLNKEIEKLGCRYSFSDSEDYMTIYLTGLEENFEKAIELLNRIVNNAINNQNIDKKIFGDFIKNEIETRKAESGRIYSEAIEHYLMFKNDSKFKKRVRIADLYKVKDDQLLSNFKEALDYETNIFYVGNNDLNKVKDIIQNKFYLSSNLKDSDSPITRKMENYKEDTVNFMNHNNTSQSYIYLYIIGNEFNYTDEAVINVFNKYFGEGMFSLVFQEVREYKSLVYSIDAGYRIPKKIKSKGYLLGRATCRSLNTIEVIKTMTGLIENLPEKKERFEDIKNNLINEAYSSRPSFRNIPNTVFNWIKFGYDKDPNEKLIEEYKKLTFDDLMNFYNANIKGKPVIITLMGNRNSFEYSKLQEIGKVIDYDVMTLD